jgi:cyclic pyranopterin phosphate synthase
VAGLQDNFGRRFSYLRLSLTDLCNFRCGYCLPKGNAPGAGTGVLSPAEIGRLAAVFARLGFWKIRLTGGEAGLRPDFLEIAARVAATPGVSRLAVTTNGYRLRERARDWRAAGISAVNVSIDSLKPGVFAAVTGHDRLPEVLDGVEAALEAGFSPVKINAVLLRGFNDGEIDGFLDFAARRPVSVRFIELMRTNENAAYFARHHLPAAVVEERLSALGWREVPREEGAGPARNFIHPDHPGRAGLIAPYGPGFCATCNRLRVSARGDLHLCLFGNMGHPLRKFLAHDEDGPALEEHVRRLIGLKAEGHLLHIGDSGGTPHLASIGG